MTTIDIENLPAELVAELKGHAKPKEWEVAIIDMINEYGPQMSLDEMLIRHYRDTGEVMKRTKLTNRLAQMTKKESLFRLKGNKGIFTTVRPEPESEAA